MNLFGFGIEIIFVLLEFCDAECKAVKFVSGLVLRLAWILNLLDSAFGISWSVSAYCRMISTARPAENTCWIFDMLQDRAQTAQACVRGLDSWI